MVMAPATLEESSRLASEAHSLSERLGVRLGEASDEVLGVSGGRYEVEEAPYGVVYRWCALMVTMRCGECEKIWLLSKSQPHCPGCGADRSRLLVRQELIVRHVRDKDRLDHPWRYRAHGSRAKLQLPF